MILLVGMVITKAVISMDEKENQIFVVKTDVVSDLPFTRNFEKPQPAENLLAATISEAEHVFTAPEVPKVNKPSFQEINPALTSAESKDEFVEEIKPLDASSNTGYGRWMGETENSEKIDDSTPLDNGNTITESISRLFPRSH